MAVRKKQRAAAISKVHGYKIRLPQDIAERIEKKAKAEQRPINRIIINELAAFPDLETVRKLAEQVGDMEVILARYGARIAGYDLSDDLRAAVDAILAAAAKGDPIDAVIDRLRVVRKVMLALDPTTNREG